MYYPLLEACFVEFFWESLSSKSDLELLASSSNQTEPQSLSGE
jgi:hypothetical protein